MGSHLWLSNHVIDCCGQPHQHPQAPSALRPTAKERMSTLQAADIEQLSTYQMAIQPSNKQIKCSCGYPAILFTLTNGYPTMRQAKRTYTSGYPAIHKANGKSPRSALDHAHDVSPHGYLARRLSWWIGCFVFQLNNFLKLCLMVRSTEVVEAVQGKPSWRMRMEAVRVCSQFYKNEGWEKNSGTRRVSGGTADAHSTPAGSITLQTWRRRRIQTSFLSEQGQALEGLCAHLIPQKLLLMVSAL